MEKNFTSFSEGDVFRTCFNEIWRLNPCFPFFFFQTKLYIFFFSCCFTTTNSSVDVVSITFRGNARSFALPFNVLNVSRNDYLIFRNEPKRWFTPSLKDSCTFSNISGCFTHDRTIRHVCQKTELTLKSAEHPDLDGKMPLPSKQSFEYFFSNEWLRRQLRGMFQMEHAYTSTASVSFNEENHGKLVAFARLQNR